MALASGFGFHVGEPVHSLMAVWISEACFSSWLWVAVPWNYCLRGLLDALFVSAFLWCHTPSLQFSLQGALTPFMISHIPFPVLLRAVTGFLCHSWLVLFFHRSHMLID